MEQRFPIITAGGSSLPIVGGTLVVAPLLGVYFRFIQHESWAVAIAVMIAVALLGGFAAVWNMRMSGKAVVISDEGIAFPRLASDEPELVPWTGIEACEERVKMAVPIEHSIEITYYGGRKRTLLNDDFADPDALVRAIRSRMPK